MLLCLTWTSPNRTNPTSTTGPMTEMNGLTMEFTTQPYDVVAGTTYHMKLAIADGKGLQLLQCQ